MDATVPKIPKTLKELELENKLKDLETKILTEQKKQMARNAFLGKHNREEYAKIDEALQIAKKDLIQTEASLKERQNEIKAKERQHLQAKMKLKLTHQRQNRGKKEKTKGKKKKNANNTQAAAEANQIQNQTPVSATA
ncbi:Oidioi.mRNA.OKI2018_I69.chr2.g4231.t1.cds [Oikopleura dioica]|uniref:Oidioi.mRNA.OKI2018_I69.chr2.g4231.t1.cds n=1 Tax=Oikopleura dioica TaxID=34765 RepID=A0ABN7T5R8_OIKDI|nr:Oidioi.mRNA.OKI2018_I69.chr2.g4231.t1.cds [Oikopleura dioica]